MNKYIKGAGIILLLASLASCGKPAVYRDVVVLINTSEYVGCGRFRLIESYIDVDTSVGLSKCDAELRHLKPTGDRFPLMCKVVNSEILIDFYTKKEFTIY